MSVAGRQRVLPCKNDGVVPFLNPFVIRKRGVPHRKVKFDDRNLWRGLSDDIAPQLGKIVFTRALAWDQNSIDRAHGVRTGQCDMAGVTCPDPDKR